MSKMSELSLAVDEIRNAAQTLLSIADTLTELFSGTAETALAAKAEPPAPKPITLEQVRAVLAEKSRAGNTDKVRELLEKHGASKLSEIEPGNYAALLKDATRVGLTEGLSDG